jgi:serine/threonine-protein kinase
MTQHEWQLGKYSVGKRIGGGMTNVHLAMNNVSHRQVVLKLVSETGEDAQEKIHAEQRGAEIQKRLAEKDDRIPKVFEWGRQEGYFYIEMEYINGKALDRTGKIGSGLAVTIAIDVCEVLELAHREGIIHGDVKPGNILDVSSDGDKTQRTTIKVLDFGVARFAASATRNLFRSVPYCSPEVRQGADYTRMDDLWSLCATIYELVEGKLPPATPTTALFTAESRSPENLQAILQRMFASDIRRRYQTATQLKADLLAFRSGGPPVHVDVPAQMPASSTMPLPSPTKSRRIPVVAIIVLVGIASLALATAMSANTMLNFERAANSAQPDNLPSIVEAAQAYNELDRLGGVPRLLTLIASNAPARLHEVCMSSARLTISRYARELDLPEKGNVSEREWKNAMEVLNIGRNIDDSAELEAMLAYSRAHYHRINAESRIGITATAERKKSERAAGLDHYTQAETYFNEALRHKSDWLDAQLGLVRLYATVFPEMDKAEAAIDRADGGKGNPPLRLQFEMAVGHHIRAAELSRTVMDSLSALIKEPTGPVAELNLMSARRDLDANQNHMQRALSYYDLCLGRGNCWDARARRTRVGTLMAASESQRSLLGEMELRFRVQLPQDQP